MTSDHAAAVEGVRAGLARHLAEDDCTGNCGWFSHATVATLLRAYEETVAKHDREMTTLLAQHAALVKENASLRAIAAADHTCMGPPSCPKCNLLATLGEPEA